MNSFRGALLFVSAASGFNVPGFSSNQRVPNSCSTLTGGTCVFPFIYNGVTHFQCTYTDSPTPWCATAVDSSGVVVTNSWGDCLCHLCLPDRINHGADMHDHVRTSSRTILRLPVPPPWHCLQLVHQCGSVCSLVFNFNHQRWNPHRRRVWILPFHLPN